MMPLPPPPPPVGQQASRPALRPGQLTPAWRVVLCLGWMSVVLAFAAVWKSGRTLGLAPWWLGPSGDPHNIAVNLIPFVLPLAMVVGALRNMRSLPYAGIVAALGVAGVAAGDAGRFSGIAVVELAVATAGLLVSVASLAGLIRAAPVPVEPRRDADPDADLDAPADTDSDPDSNSDALDDLVTGRSSATQ
jgi:hypothetical protein